MREENGEIVPAGAFIPIIEQLGMTRLMDRHVLDMAVAELAAAPENSRPQYFRPDRDRPVLAARADLGGEIGAADRPGLIVEITGTAALHDIEGSARFVNVVRDLGCRVAIDDFGAGFTSFRHLKALTVDMVKIDGSFVRNLTNNVDNQLFIRNLMGLPRPSDWRPSRSSSRMPMTRPSW